MVATGAAGRVVCSRVLMPSEAVAVRPESYNARPGRKLRPVGDVEDSPRAPRGERARRCQETDRRARLPGLRLPLPVDGGRRRALVSQPRRAARAGGPRGHVPHAPPMGRGRRAADPRGAGGRGVALRRALRAGRQPPRRPAGAVRMGRPASPAAPRPPLRRGASVLVPVLLGPRRRRRAAARALPAGGRLVRGLERRLLAGVPGPGRRPHRPCRPASVRPRSPAGHLLLTPVRGPASGGGSAAAAADRRRVVRRRPDRARAACR